MSDNDWRGSGDASDDAAAGRWAAPDATPTGAPGRPAGVNAIPANGAAGPNGAGPRGPFPPAPPRLSQQSQSVRPPAFHRPPATGPVPAGAAPMPLRPPPVQPAGAVAPQRVAGYPAVAAPQGGVSASGFPVAQPPPRDPWPTPVRAPAWLAAPSLPQSARPTYREPLPVKGGRLAGGIGLGALWMLLFGVFAGTVQGYLWLSLIAGALAALVSFTLTRFGDRGFGVGVAIAAGLGVSAAGAVVALRLLDDGGWLLW